MIFLQLSVIINEIINVCSIYPISPLFWSHTNGGNYLISVHPINLSNG